MSNHPNMQIGSISNKINQYRDWSRLAREQTGKTLLTQLNEIRLLKGTGGQCGVSDYYGYGLYNDSYLMGRGRQDYLGWRLQAKFSLALNPRHAVLPAWDKTVFMQLASSAGLPVAPVNACFHRSAHISSALGLHLKTSEDVGVYLRNSSQYPMFGKPAFSQQGQGSAYLAKYDSSSDMLSLLDGKVISVNDFVNRLEKSVDLRYHKPECGYLFQSSLTLSPTIQALTNWPAVCGVRIVCLNGPEGVQPIRAVWKVATPPNHVDNFSLGKNGNFLANVDLVTGQVSKMLSGFWPSNSMFDKHPATGQVVEGFQLPGWSEILDACQRAGAAFPLMKIHHWDFALTDQGPVILELNDVGATEMLQIHGHGLLTNEVRAFIKRHGDARSHPWIRAL